MTRILIVEDDVDYQAALKKALSQDNFTVELVSTGKDATQLLACSSYELIVLDWELPDLSGLDICKTYRRNGGEAPILFTTGRDLITDKEQGFELGADDYLTKPFHIKEFLLRVKALLRRHKSITEDVLRFADLELDAKTKHVLRQGEPLRLPPKEFHVLQFLMRHPTQVFSATELLQHVWSSDSTATEQTVRACVKRLRELLDLPGQPSHIFNYRSHGYMLNRDLLKIIGTR